MEAISISQTLLLFICGTPSNFSQARQLLTRYALLHRIVGSLFLTRSSATLLLLAPAGAASGAALEAAAAAPEEEASDREAQRGGNRRRGDKGEATEGVAMEGEATEDEAEVGSDSMTHNAPTVRGIQSYILKDHIPRGTGKRNFQKHVRIPFPAEPW